GEATSELLTALEAAGHTVVVLGDFIRPGVPLGDCKMAPDYLIDDEALTSRCVGDDRQAEKELRYNEELAALLGERFIEINEVQCPAGVCRFFDGHTSLFRDHHHLSIEGSMLFVGEIERRLWLSLIDREG
ncbi:MAG: SGNH hydrolase domain-containing protein, partial [Myxococcota bacterium]